MKKIAIITRTKNRPQLLRRCADNLSKQTMKNFQWVIVNDAGMKNEVDTIANYAQTLGLDVHLLHRDRSEGIAAAANHGINNSQSELIHLHDDDDSVELNFYELMSKFLDIKQYYGGVVCSTSKIVERILPSGIQFVRKEVLHDSNMATHLSDVLVKNQFTTISFVYRRSAFIEIGGYDNILPVLEDWDFNIRFSELFDIGAIKECLANYHHRIPDPTEKNPQTITGASELHEEFSAILRNRYMRNADTGKKMELAIVMANGRFHQLVSNRLKLIDDYVRSSNVVRDSVKNFLMKILR